MEYLIKEDQFNPENRDTNNSFKNSILLKLFKLQMTYKRNYCYVSSLTNKKVVYILHTLSCIEIFNSERKEIFFTQIWFGEYN